MSKKSNTISVIQKWVDAKNAYYVSSKNFIDFRQSINIKNDVFDKTAKHTKLLKPIEIKCEISGAKMYDLYSIPISTQNSLKPVLNSKQLLQNSPPHCTKSSMAVNQQYYTKVPEQQLLDYYSALRSDPLNQNLNPATSVKYIKNEIINDNILSTITDGKNYVNVRDVETLVNDYPLAKDALKQVISTRFRTSTCNVLEKQYYHLIENRKDPQRVKEIITDMEDTLNREKINQIDYTTYEQQEVEKSHYFVKLFKSFF